MSHRCHGNAIKKFKSDSKNPTMELGVVYTYTAGFVTGSGWIEKKSNPIAWMDFSKFSVLGLIGGCDGDEKNEWFV